MGIVTLIGEASIMLDTEESPEMRRILQEFIHAAQQQFLAESRARYDAHDIRAAAPLPDVVQIRRTKGPRQI